MKNKIQSSYYLIQFPIFLSSVVFWKAGCWMLILKLKAWWESTFAVSRKICTAHSSFTPCLPPGVLTDAHLLRLSVPSPQGTGSVHLISKVLQPQIQSRDVLLFILNFRILLNKYSMIALQIVVCPSMSEEYEIFNKERSTELPENNCNIKAWLQWLLFWITWALFVSQFHNVAGPSKWIKWQIRSTLKISFPFW